jgi:hypothetical protein
MMGGYYDKQHDGMNSGGMMWGQGPPGLLGIIVPVLAIAALVKSLFSDRRFDSPAGMSRIS